MTHPILERLASDALPERLAACRAAPDDPSAVLLIDALGAALADPSPRVARAASDALGRIGKQHDVAAPLRAALHGPARRARWQAVRALARLEPPGPKLLPALVEALDSEDRWEAARILVDTGRLHGEVLPLLLGLARDTTSPALRRMASHCLRELAPDRPECAAALLEVARDPEPEVRGAALAAIAGLREPPPEVAKHLREAEQSERDPELRALARRALAVLAGGSE